MNANEFYDRYWTRPGGAIPERSFLLRERRALLQAAVAGLPPWAPVLDAGCGSGEFSAFLRDLGLAPTGVDISGTAVSRARQRCPGGRFIVGSLGGRLPFADQEFAAVWCTEVIEHLLDVYAALAELNRVLQLGGPLILTTPFHGLAKNMAIALLGFEKHYDPYRSHIRFFTPRIADPMPA